MYYLQEESASFPFQISIYCVENFNVKKGSQVFRLNSHLQYALKPTETEENEKALN
jgi:hypothetical protein